jgi:hypothetical protein
MEFLILKGLPIQKSIGERSVSVTPGFEPKLNAHHMCVQDQVFTHMNSKINIE